MEILLESIHEEWARLVRHAPRVLAALLVLVVFVVLGGVLGRGLDRMLRRGRVPVAHRGFFRDVARWALVGVGLVVALNIVGLHGVAASLVAGGGVTAIVLGFAFRGIVENFLAGFFLVIGRTFKVGDLIRSGEFEGVVRAIELRHTHVRTADGRDVFIPSIDIFSEPLTNLTRDGLRRMSFTIGIDYADDVEVARESLLDEVRQTEGVLDTPPPGVNIRDFDANFVVLETFFWIDTLEQQVQPFNVRTLVMQNCRRRIIASGHTVSSEVSTNIVLHRTSGPEV